MCIFNYFVMSVLSNFHLLHLHFITTNLLAYYFLSLLLLRYIISSHMDKGQCVTIGVPTTAPVMNLVRVVQDA
jgi:hypothetical protein